MRGKAETAKDLKLDDKYWKEPNADNFNDLDKKTQQNIKTCAWSNQFAFPWEIGMYWNLTVGGAGKRAMGKKNIVLKFGLSEKHTKFGKIFLMVWMFTK